MSESTEQSSGGGGAWAAWWRSDEARRYPAAVGAGLLFALTFPIPGVAGFGWVAPGLLWCASAGLGRAAAFRVGWVAGFVGFLVSLRWLCLMPFPLGAVAAWLALSAYCALYFGAWSVLANLWWVPGSVESVAAEEGEGRWFDRLGNRPPMGLVGGVGWPSWCGWIPRHAAWAGPSRWFWTMKAAAAWVALEWVRGVLMSGFPWNFLGVSQWRQAPLIQVASYTGVYGVSFIMVWFSLGLVGGLATVLGRPDRRLGWMTDLRWPVLALCGVLAWGFYKVLDDRKVEVGEGGRWLTLGLVQPSIRQTLMWDPEAGEASFLVAERLSQQALALGIDVLVWPEGSFGLSGTNFHQMRRQVRDAGVSWIFGSDGYDETEEGKPLVFNSAYMVGPDGQVEARYDKCRLVIFGEYVPLERWLPFLRWLTPIGSSFAVGSGPVPFRAENGAWEISPVICFEDIFPRATSRHVMEETDLLLELTNDGWFGESSAQWQHAANAAFRAVENGVPLVRCTNNGLTGWLDGSGLVREWLGGSGAAVHASGFLRVRIPLRGDAWQPTFYRQWGDWFPVLCVIITIIRLRIGDARGARNSPDQERRLR